MKKLITALTLATMIAVPIQAAPLAVQVHASSINDLAKQDSYGGVTYADNMLAQEGIKYNSFAENAIPYRNGKPEGIVIHETATPNATAHDEAIYFNREWKNIYAYVHAFVDKTGVIQMMSPDSGTWGAGPQANDRFIQVELCEENNAADFAKGVNNDAIYAAALLHHYGLQPDNAVHDGQGTIWSHHAVSQYLGGTDHTDPDGYFAKWGYTMDDFYNLVKYYYDNQNGTTADNNSTTNTPANKPSDTPEADKPAATLPKPTGTKTLMHDALVYDENGDTTSAATKTAGTKLTLYGYKTIAGKKYLQIGLNQFVVASNVDGKLRKVKHNAYLYNANGYRIGKGKLYRRTYIRTYGGRVKIAGHKYYQIDVNEFVKVGNF
ncbi:SLAP domain-containing protein [Lactobacillus sp. ESL0677]|uniref:SLAP domain-containing protein n=1 Tax=Lactobacillus sp. ESL0677 TaxID=2983208 RepID=UPI0023F6C24A|nr:SLAP domain-containing protein [Lactobacillus sp. ESL0677]WEV36798.1 SLAP domain-containing protein [Lactobacillus sp. ESL0677]